MGTGPPRLHRRLIVAFTLLATAGLSVAPASRAETGIGAAPNPAAAALAAVETVVSAETAVAEVESVLALAPAPALVVSAEATRRELANVVSAAAPAITSAAAEVEARVSSATGAAPAIPAPSRPRAAVASGRSGTAPRPAHVRPERTASVKPSSGVPTVGRELAITANEPVAIPVATGSERLEAQRATSPQPSPAPPEPAEGGYATGVAPAFVLVFVVTVIALFLARSGLGPRVTSLLASPPNAALALELERPG